MQVNALCAENERLLSDAVGDTCGNNSVFKVNIIFQPDCLFVCVISKVKVPVYSKILVPSLHL
jgi:hypothetical protein